MRLKKFVKMMHELRLDAMAEQYQLLSKSPEFATRSTDSVLQELIGAQHDAMTQRRIDSALAKSNIPYLSAHRQALDYSSLHWLNRDYFERILACEWVASRHNIVFTGGSHTGKRYLASVVVREATSLGYSSRCYTLSELLELLMLKRQQPTKGTKTELMKFRLALQKVDVLVLIGLGQHNLTQSQCEDLDMVIRLRQQHGAIVVTSPIQTKRWHEYFGDTPASDSICASVLGNAHCFHLAHKSKATKEHSNEKN